MILTTIPLAVLAGYLLGGRLRGLATASLRWPAIALAGVGLQFVPVEGTPGYLALLASFACLITFAVANARQPGFVLIYVGLALNLAVIAIDQGMPVTRDALVISGQRETLAELRKEAGSKHHLATDRDSLLFLADVIPVPPPVAQAISVGDIAAHLGVAWFVMRGMQRRETVEPVSAGFA
ncbi:MAG TPA: DUF5317 family protein [Actinomycetota bacterium]|nr:DUF5317 family protein [Actinomycetota bacterium]